jgi:hypothetical protein
MSVVRGTREVARPSNWGGISVNPGSRAVINLVPKKKSQGQTPEDAMKSQKKVILLLGLFGLGLLCVAQTPLRVKVITDYADIRLQPALNSEVLNVAIKGEIFAVTDKSGAWYKIKFSTDQTGQVTYGYIHESEVTPVEMTEGQKEVMEKPTEPESLAKPIEEKHPVQPKEETLSQQSQKQANPPQRVFSGTSLKFGFGEDRWIASLSTDFGIHRNFALGFELQPYYKKDSEINLTTLDMNFFINAKAGVRFSFISLYGGGGLGPNLSWSVTEIEGESFSQFKTKLAYHLLAGTGLNLGPIAFIFEYQMIKISDAQTGPNSWGHFFLVGLRF